MPPFCLVSPECGCLIRFAQGSHWVNRHSLLRRPMVLRCHTRQMTAIGRRAATWGQSWSWNAARTAVSVLQRVPRNQSKWAVSSPFFWTGWRVRTAVQPFDWPRPRASSEPNVAWRAYKKRGWAACLREETDTLDLSVLLCLYFQVASSFTRVPLYVHQACILTTLVGILLTLIVLRNNTTAFLDLALFS